MVVIRYAKYKMYILTNREIFSGLDLRKAYYNIPMHPGNIERNNAQAFHRFILDFSKKLIYILYVYRKGGTERN